MRSISPDAEGESITDCSSNLAAPSQAFLSACSAHRLNMQSATALSPRVVFWQASEKPPGSLSVEQAHGLKVQVQGGTGLVVTLDAFPGLSPLLLGAILPTTGVATQARPSAYAAKEELAVAWVDRQFFPEALEGLMVPFCRDIRPAPAVERGQARYERYSFVHPALHVPIAANSDFWSRSLLNREWTVRARCSGVAQLPLVVTGRFGAGKVVMVATSVSGIGESLGARRFWLAVLRWLLQAEEAGKARAVTPGLATTVAGAEAHVVLTNPAATPLPLQVVVRALSADGSMLADGSGEWQRSILLAPHQASTVKLALPVVANAGIPGQQQLRLRVGALSGDGGRLLVEQRLLTPPSALQLKVRTDNLYALPYPFPAAGPNALAAFTARMGAFAAAYAYLPGQTVAGTVDLSNGFTNLALLSTVEDQTTPGNASAMALNDNATGSRSVPGVDGIEACSMWAGKAGAENLLRFTLPAGAYVTEVVLVGSYGASQAEIHNPGHAVIEADDRIVAGTSALDADFTAGYGQASLAWVPCPAGTLTVRLPWVARRGSVLRQVPWLGEVRIYGWVDTLPRAALSVLTLELVDAMSGQRQSILQKKVAVSGCTAYRSGFTVPLPLLPGIRFYRLEAAFATIRASAPLLTIKPSKPLLPMSALRPENCAGVGLNVSRGFREVFDIGTGTAEPTQGWSSPDDLIWSYSRQLKQIPRNVRTAASRLYLSASDMRHYITPWCSFSNGELFFSIAAQRLVNNLKHDRRWANANIVQLTFADRWDTGPNLANLHGWQDYVEFDRALRASSSVGLGGRTLLEVEQEVETQFADRWQAWQLDRYLHGIRCLRDAFLVEGKSLIISAQGVPMVAGRAGKELSLCIRGMSDDCTWSMLDESPVFTTGRQMSELAFNPVWQMSASLPWGFNSPVTNNWQWHAPVGTTEPSRRHIYDRAWRGTLWPGRGFGSVYTFGFVNNAGVGYTMTEQDFQQWWYVQERHSLLTPEIPLGAGLIISTQRSADPEHIRFTCGDPLSLEEPRTLAQSFRNLHNAGVSLPFAANASALSGYKLAAPLIVLNLAAHSAEEVAMLTAAHAGGTRLAAFADKNALSPEAADLFSRPGTLLIEGSAATLTHAEAMTIAGRLLDALELPLSFPPGSAGYGFRSQGTTFVVLEDWLEQARVVELRVSKSRGAYAAVACDVNDHQALVVRESASAWQIEVPLRSGDGVLIALQEQARDV